MITEDDLRTLLSGDLALPSLSPLAVRRRARVIRRGRRAGLAGLLAIVLPVAVLGVRAMPGAAGLTGRSPIGAAAGTLPEAFDGDGTPLSVPADGRVALDIPHLTAWIDSEALCLGHVVGDYVQSDLPSGCTVAGVQSGGIEVVNGVIGSFSSVPVVRADYIDGSTVAHAQVVGFARHPQWRTLTARWPGDEDSGTNILVRGWDASGKLILSEGCVGGCPIPAEPSQVAQLPEPGVPAAVSASAPVAPIVVPEKTTSVIEGVQAWPTSHGVCVGDQNSTQCVTDGDTAIDDGFALGKDIAVTIVGKPLVKAEFLVGTTAVQAMVLGFASHPQWRVVAANIKIPGAAGKPVSLKGWDADGNLVVDFDPTK